MFGANNLKIPNLMEPQPPELHKKSVAAGVNVGGTGNASATGPQQLSTPVREFFSMASPNTYLYSLTLEGFMEKSSLVIFLNKKVRWFWQLMRSRVTFRLIYQVTETTPTIHVKTCVENS